MPQYVYALHDFLPENDDEVSFHAGERIEVIEKDDLYGDGWWHVCIHFSLTHSTDPIFHRAVILLAVLVSFLSATQHRHPHLPIFLRHHRLPNLFLILQFYQTTMANSLYSLYPKNPNPNLQALVSSLLSQNTLLSFLTMTTTTIMK